MVLAVRGVKMDVDEETGKVDRDEADERSERIFMNTPLEDVAEAFGFFTETEYLDALEQERSHIFKRMQW